MGKLTENPSEDKKKRKMRRSMNYANNIEARAAEINPLACVGASAMGFPDKISPVRSVMEARHTSQRVVLDQPEFAHLFTGAENPFGQRSSFNHKADDDYEITKIFKKFKDFDTSEIVYFMRNVHTGRYKCEIFEAGAHNNVEKYGFKMINYMTNKHEGDYVPKGTILQQSSSYVDDNYCAGLNARIMYTVLPQLTEDSLIVSDEFAKRAAYNMVDIIKVKLSKNSFMLNTYGDDSLYKSFPNVGEYIKNDVLLSIRENSMVSSKQEAKFSHINDQDKISHGVVVDIDVYSNNETENDQLNYYWKCCQDYYNDIYTYISMIVQDKSQDDNGILDLYHRAEKYISEAKWVSKEHILDTVIIFKVLQRQEIKVGQKVVGRYGNKSVISKIIPAHLMPKTDDGRPVDMLANGLSINNRIIFFALYESTITFMCERLHQYTLKCLSEGMSNDEVMVPIVDFCKMFNTLWGEEVDRLYHENPIEGIEDIKQNGIYIHIPPLGEQSTRDAILEAYDKYPHIFTKYKVFAKLRHRWIQLKGEHAIGYQYTWVLKQEPSKAMSAVSTGRTTLYDQPVKTKAFNKNNARHYSDNPIKFGEYDTYNFLAGVSVADFAKISTYFRGSQYEDNSVLMSHLNNCKIDTSRYNTFPQLEQLKNILKLFGEKFDSSIFDYGTIAARDQIEHIFINNIELDIPVTELRHILLLYAYYLRYRAQSPVIDMGKFYDDMYNTDEIYIGYDMQYREYILHKFANMIPILDQLKQY